MADSFDLQLEWPGLDELADYFRTRDKRFVKIALEEFALFGLDVVQVAQDLSPEDSGDLADSINMDDPTFINGVISVVIGTNLDYALRRHEEPERQGVYDKYEEGVKYEGYYVNGRGERTRNKANVSGFKPGRKYLTNAMTANEDSWNKMIDRILTRVLEEN